MEKDVLSQYLSSHGCRLVLQGKTKDVWSLPSPHQELLLVLSDQLVYRDFTLKAVVPKKGEIATALTHFWLSGPLKHLPHHLIESKYRQGVNAAYDLKMDLLSNLPIERCLLVKNLDGRVLPFNLIQRGYIGGSIYADYRRTGKVSGQSLQANLPKWWKLPNPVFTPSERGISGGTIELTVDEFLDKTKFDGQVMATLSATAYDAAHYYALNRGLVILDAKLQTAKDESGLVMLEGEILTPQCARFTLESVWEKAVEENRDPAIYGRSLLEQWSNNVETPFGVRGISQLDSGSAEHREFVASLEVPEEVIFDITQLSGELFRRLTGLSLPDYQKKMGIVKY